MKTILAAIVVLLVSVSAQAKPYLNDYVGSEMAAICAVQIGWAYSARSASVQNIPVQTVYDDINSKFPARMNQQVYVWYQLAHQTAGQAYGLSQYTPEELYYLVFEECVSAVGVNISRKLIDEMRGEAFTPYVPFE